MESIEIARRQIDFAIKTYNDGYDLAGVATVTPAAIRILQDLTMSHPASMKSIMNELADDAGYPREELWREFYNATANPFKHADRQQSFPDLPSVIDRQDQAICHAIYHYILATNTVTGVMKAYMEFPFSRPVSGRFVQRMRSRIYRTSFAVYIAVIGRRTYRAVLTKSGFEISKAALPST